MANTLAYSTLFQTNLDKAMVQTAQTSWMEENAGQVIYNGGKEVKIPKMTLTGLRNYDRNSGYKKGKVTLEYETKSMTYDRGTSFYLDSMDVNETNFVATAGTVMGEFQRTKVVPEVDAIRIATLAQVAITANNVKASYTPGKTTIVDAIKDGITVLRDKGFVGEIVIHCTYEVKNQLEKAMAGQLSAVTFSAGGVDTEVPSLDGCPILPLTSDKMYSKFDISDEEEGGFSKAADAKTLNFLLVAREVPIAVCKTDKIRVFDPSVNQEGDGYSFDYRKYHDIWVLDNKVNGVFACYKEA